ncbi:MAG: RNA polymerase sigma factor SigJ [Planctomycetaceae bacterium]|nr:RNA polymerase sigma factor SigJ [Planctomycetaceae bacterium]
MNVNHSELRPRMMSVAYRMLGSVADAEDAVQDAFLRLQGVEDVTSPEGFLVKATTRRCIDQLRTDRRRKKYIGPWVPEPIATKEGMQNSALAESLSQAFLLMLERLTPNERAAFLLRSVFDYEYAQIAEVLGKSEVHVRQLVSRARSRLMQDAPRFRPAPHEAEGLAERFVAACRLGDVTLVEQLLTEDVEVHSDGGGKVPSARVVIRGRSRAARYLAGVFSRKFRDRELRVTTVNGEPGVVLLSNDAVRHVISLRIEDGVRGVYLTNNPDKLSHWSVAEID